ncbi:GrdX family protein [Anaeromicrobium sediminis]|uniref:GrdX protein n=1 Tax=Anaeromicrobium sediminis TaxID=1478221 RepID=A0A267MNQ8_9FIRM|nr:GrdX family protein [Anaeromicrobium sediminis]PAB61057.1 hypothetical protein CCE28_01100 [Anaeromicrobium sediminis]
MEYKIISNNPMVKNEFENTIWVDGNPKDVLIKTRDLLHQDYELVTHPLNASIKMVLSPVKSIILRKIKENKDLFQLEVIEDSILKYDNLYIKNGHRKRKEHYKDFAMIDYTLLKSGMEEVKSTFGGEFLEIRNWKYSY